MAEAERRFPVIRHQYAHMRVPCPHDVPWSFLTPHEVWAMQNHSGQTLEALAQRGGLDPTEIIAVVEHRRWSPMGLAEAAARLAELLEEHAHG